MVQQLTERPGHQYDDNWRPEHDELEEAYNAPDAEYLDGHPSSSGALSDDEIENRESSTSSMDSDQGSDEEDSLYNSQSKNGRSGFRLSRSQGIAGGIAGLLIAGTIGTISITSGPLKLLHMGQLLKTFHFSSQEDAGSDRMSKIAKYIRYRNKPERARLGRLGNAYADRIEKRFNQSGIESSYSKRGYGDGYIIDPANLPENSDLGEIVNKDWGTSDPEVIKAKVQEAVAKAYDLDVSKVGFDDAKGLITIDSSDVGYFKNRKLIKSVMETAGLDGLGGSMRARIMGKRSGITWHPMKALDKKLYDTLDKRLAEWRKERQNRLDDGETTVKAQDPSNTEDTNGDGTPDQPSDQAQQASDQTREVADQAHSADTEIRTDVPEPKPDVNTGSSGTSGLESFRASTSLKIAGGVSAAVGIICTLKSLSDNFDKIKYANIVLPMMRAGMEMIALSDQIKSGKDVDLEQLSFYSEKLYRAAGELSNTTNKGKVTESVTASSAFSARSIQAEEGKPLTGEDIPDEARLNKDGNIVGKIINAIPGVNGVCDAASSFFGQVISIGLDVIGGPFSAAAGFAFGATVAPKILDGIVNWLAGHPLNIINISGAPLGGILNYGARLASNDSAIAAGGRELTGTETAELKVNRMNAEKERLASKGTFARLFDIYDSGSLAAKVIDSTPGNVQQGTQNIASMFSNVTSLLSSPLRLASDTLGGQAFAAESYDYGFPEFGFSMDELNNSKFENPYDNANQALALLAGSSGDSYIKKAKDCLGITLTADGSTVKSVDSAPNYTDILKDSSCNDKSDDWARVRFYIFDTQIMDSQACYEGDNESCSNIGFDDSGSLSSGSTTPTDVTDKRQDTSGMACATLGLTGEQVVPVGDGSIKIKLCDYGAVKGVNASWSNNMSQMIDAAKKDGVNLAGGGFRTAAEQIRLRSVNGCPDIYTASPSSCRVPTAIPGTSNHELGLAIDYSTITSQCFGKGATTCVGNQSYDWLTRRAAEFKVKKLRTEAWHWSVDGR